MSGRVNRKFYGLLEVDYKLRPRQEESLQFIDNNDDFIVVLPTGAGKTLIAVIAEAKILSEGGKVIMLSPLKTLTNEQTNTLRGYFPNHKIILDDGDNRKDVEEYGDWSIAILTYERFNGLLNTPNKRRIFNDVKLIVIDEVHNLGDESRGATLESAIIKMRILFPKSKIIGLSATIDNAKEFSSWLNTKLVLGKKSERPVPLSIKLVMYTENYNAKLNLKARVDIVRNIMRKYPNKTLLIFTTSRQRTKDVVYELAGKYVSLDEAINLHNIGWHNAGMSKDSKIRVESMFREGKIKLIACTPTLAMGVNLPADIVVMFDLFQFSYLTGKEVIPKSRLEQTMGRAGRPGLSDMGYAYLLCPNNKKMEIIELLKTPFRVESQLKSNLTEKLLEWITAGIINSESKYVKVMPYFMDKSITKQDLNNSLKWLLEHRFIRVGNVIESTFKGRMTSRMMIKPMTVVHWENALYDKNDLSNAELFCLIASAPEYAGIVVPYRFDADKINYAKEFVDARPEVYKKFVHYFGDVRVDFTDNIFKIFALTYNKELMSKYRLDRNDFKMSSGDKYTVEGAADRYLSAASILCVNHKEPIAELHIGSKHSIISGGIIELSRLKGVGDVRLNLLLKNNINSIESFISTSNDKLSNILKLRNETIKKIKINSVDFL